MPEPGPSNADLERLPRQQTQRWDDRKRAEVLKAIATGAGHQEVSDRLGVPLMTLKTWVKEYPEALARAREDYMRTQGEKLMFDMQALALESVSKARERLEEAKFRDLAIGAGIATQRYMELHSGIDRPQIHVHLTREQLEDQLKQLTVELAEDAVEEVTDVEK